MTVNLELSDEDAARLASHLGKAHSSYMLMQDEADRAGDKLAARDYFSEAKHSVKLRTNILSQLDSKESVGGYTSDE